jgi:predicted DNA-binding transcriptional regulator AlpA
MTPDMLSDELRRRVAIADSGCWEWTGNRDQFGYGRYRGKSAHRLVFVLMVGTIPDGLHLDHLCRVRRCVYPVHLEPVTQAENNRRRDESLGYTIRDSVRAIDRGVPESGREFSAERIVGPQEVAQTLGVSRQRVFQLAMTSDFPVPIASLAMGKLWDLAHIEKWARKQDRTIHPLDT